MSNLGSSGDGLGVPNLALPNILSIAREIMNRPITNIYQNSTQEMGAAPSDVLPANAVIVGNTTTASVTVNGDISIMPIIVDSTGTPLISGSPILTTQESPVVTLSLAADSPHSGDNDLVTPEPMATEESPQPIVDSAPPKITIETVRASTAAVVTTPVGRAQ
ncbi:hypothetical protein RRF57_007548 [Xylaria bambusicola]|uniref:Uncharacterized protein n=1 Tax=Xylaria bambusicola TaxID=326684 RepID=A0AAN7V0R8_9PEZI